MPGLHRIMQALAALMLLLSLGLAPVVDAVTHGPGTAAAEAEHAAFHADRGENWQTAEHGHHDATDHDHATQAILPDRATTLVVLGAVIELRNLGQMTDVIRDGPRRPPRLALC